MLLKRIALLFCAILLGAGFLVGQTTTSNILGTVTDPGDAVVPNVEVQLKNSNTGEVRTFSTGPEGMFRFNSVPSGTYSITLKAQAGFKAYTQQAIALEASATRDLGRIKLELGSVTEEVSVTATASAVQVASSEKSALVDGTQLNSLALKGRDMFGMLALLPGVTANGSEVVSNSGLASVTINGSGMGRHNFTVDGVSDMDTGANNAAHFTPNLDSIAEIKVLTSNYQAEYGRMSGGQISVITKGGGQEFHGSAWTNKRHEMFNANSFFNNYNNLPKSFYRYFVYGYSLGGPVYIPGKWNTDKRRVFFFASNEWTKQRPNTSNYYANMPTALERAGDFSKSFNSNCQTLDGTGCSVTQLYDPSTRAPIPGNNLRNAGYLGNPYGLAMLNFLPMPNRCDLTNNAAGCWNEGGNRDLYGTRRNYLSSFTGSSPFRNDTYRVDVNVSSRLTTWVRYGNNAKVATGSSSYELMDASGKRSPFYQIQPNSGHGYAAGATLTLSPTMVNEFNAGKSWNTWSFYPINDAMLSRDRMNNPPSFSDFSKDPRILADQNQQRPAYNTGSLNFMNGIPNVSFGGGLSSNQAGIAFNSGGGNQLPYTNWNNIYTANDNLSYVRGVHSFKTGVYFERTQKVQQNSNGNYLGNYNFAAGNTAMTADAGNGYANAYLGNFQSYSEGDRVVGNFWFNSLEFYVQDSWRVHKRLTLDLGMRFYHTPNTVNVNDNTAIFNPSSYVPGASARLYYPACGVTSCSSQRAYDPATGTYTYSALVGTFVPGTGSYSNGSVVVGGPGGLPRQMYDVSPLVPAIRFGLAWDVFGNGKTAIRTGFGQNFNRGDQQQVMYWAGAAPVTKNQTIYYSDINSVPSYKNSGAVSPVGNGGITGSQKLENTMSTSLGIQQNVGFGTIVEASYVGSFRRHILESHQMNAIPMFAQYDPQNYNPVSASLSPLMSGKALADNYLRPLKGLAGVTNSEFAQNLNYHSLQISVRRAMARGFSYSVAYTMGKSIQSGYSPYAYIDEFFKNRNKSVSYAGAPHVITASYVYEVPGIGKRLNLRQLGWVTDGWQLSGITQLQSHSRANLPGLSWNTSPTPNMTGSYEGARYIVNGDLNGAYLDANGNSASSPDFYHTYNWKALIVPSQCSWAAGATPQQGIGQSMACFGNAGGGQIFSIPTIMNNWDMTLSKSFKLKAERRRVTFRAEAYNIFNHTQFSGFNTTPTIDYATWRSTGELKNTNASLGRATSAREPRKISLNLRLEF